jgi:Protein of unknown function (DUF3565)
VRRGQESSLWDADEVEWMRRVVVGFYQDDEGDWAARLECGHGLHVRHDPPWTVREWVVTEAGRMERIGTVMECKRCDEDTE